VRRRAILYVPHHFTGWVLEALRHRFCPCSRSASRLPTGLVNLSKNNRVERRSTLVEEDQLEIACMARLSRRCPCPSLLLPRAGPQCARRWSRSLGMRTRAVRRMLSSLVTERRLPMSSRRVGWAGLVGSGAQIHGSGPSWKRGMVGGGDVSRAPSGNGNTWILRMRWTLPSEYFPLLVR